MPPGATRAAAKADQARCPRAAPAVLVACALAASVGAGCSSPADAYRRRGLALADGGRLDDAVAELRLAVASDPRDPASRAALGRLEARAGRPGAALRELAIARRLGDRSVDVELAELLVRRAASREALGHRERWRDLAEARRLDPGRAAALGSAFELAVLDAGVARWAAGDVAAARGIWARLPGGRAARPAGVAALEDPGRTPLPVLAAAAARVLRVGGDRAAAPLLEAYVRGGGHDANTLALAARVRRALEPGAELDDLVAAASREAGGAARGLERLCGPDLAGPPESCVSGWRVVAVAALTEPPWRLPWRGGRALRAAPPETLATAVSIALAAWLWGEQEEWLDGEARAYLGREVDGRDATLFPPWVRPTLLRLRGDAEGARRARAEAATGDPPGSPARLVLAFEHALAGDGAAAAVLLDGLGDEPLVWLARATIARITGDAEAERVALGEAARRPAGAAALVRRFDLAPILGAEGSAVPESVLDRWRAVVRQLPASDEPAPWIAERLAVGPTTRRAAPSVGAGRRPAVPRRPGCGSPDGAAREALARALREDAARAERLALAYVDAEPSAHCRGLDVLALYAEAGDGRRALAWAERLLAEEPTDGDALGAAVEAAIAVGDLPLAELYRQRAEFWARARGAPSLAAARSYLRAGHAVEAIGAARQALALADGETRWSAFEGLAAASLAAGRDGDARRAFEALRAELPARLLDGARRRIRALAGLTVPRRLAWLDGAAAAAPEAPIGADDGAAAAGALGPWLAGAPDGVFAAIRQAELRAADGERAAAAALLDEALRLTPWSVAARAARARLEDRGSTRRLELQAELLLVGLLDDGAGGARALEAFAGLVEADGLGALARSVRREARARGE